MTMAYWEIIVVVLIVLASAGYLALHFTRGRRQPAGSKCTGECAGCPYVEGDSDCDNPVVGNGNKGA
jgi:FeoB-associated Cys-rich membrane protein